MSASERFGTEVWQAVIALDWHSGESSRRLMTVGEVASMGRVSRATAKKYLMVLVKRGVLATFPVGKRWVYQYIGDGRDV